MEGRTKLLCRCLTGPPALAAVGRLLLGACLLALTLFAAPRAHAQAEPRLAVSEFGWEFAGPDRTREYWEVANIGDTPWNPNGYWAARLRGDVDPYFIQIQGVDPVPPGGVLLLEWGRPLDEDDLSTACTTQGNVFCTGRPDAQQSSDFEDHAGSAAVMIFAPRTDNQPPTLDTGTMLCYFFYGDLDETDKDLIGYTKAVEKKLWKASDAAGPTGKEGVPIPKALEWVVALRMGPGPYPADYGRSTSDYFLTLAGIKEITIEGLTVTNPTTPAPNETNRAGTPHQPNYLHPGRPLPGQIAAGFRSVQAQATTASLVTNAPATGLQVLGINPDGAVATSLFSNNAWSPWTPMAGLPAVDGVAMVDNPRLATRSLLLRAKTDGALSLSAAAGDRDKVFGASVALGLKAQFAPAAAVDPATGKEYYVAVEAGTGAIQVAVNENGKVGPWQPIAGAKTDAPVAARFSPDPAGLNVVYWNGNQLVLTRMGADGTFAAPQNIGAAVLSDRTTGTGPVVDWNPAAKGLEVVVRTGPALKADLQHSRVALTAAGEAKASAFAKIGGIGTDAQPAIAIDPNSGQIRLLARGGGTEPGLNPGQEGTVHDIDFTENDPQSGFVFETTFDGSAWSAPKRVGIGRLPGPSPATPLFKAPVAPVSLFDANTKQFDDFLIGEDAEVYSNVVGQ